MAKTALVLGTGLVSRPCVEHLLQSGLAVICVSAVEEELISLQGCYPAVNTKSIDVKQDKISLQQLIKSSDVVISLLPATLHVMVAIICIEEKKNLVTASYLNDEMQRLHVKAVEAGITILVEAGLDPGIDHMIAMRCVDTLKDAGAEVTELTSLCGGIPANESSSGPLKYKFSWYPKGMFIAASQPAKFCREGQIHECDNILQNPEVMEGLFEEYPSLECLPNRESLMYHDIYSIQSASTVYRGTLRYKGFSRALQALASVGFTKETSLQEFTEGAPNLTWKELTSKLLGLPNAISSDDLKQTLLLKFDGNADQLRVLTELGILSDETVPVSSTLLDSLSIHLAKLLAYEPGEEDLVLMFTRVAGRFSSGEVQTIETSLVEKGRPVGGHSAMSWTVGLTAASCAGLLLSGAVQRKGVILPITKDIYEPVLSQLSSHGIKINTTVKDST